LISAETTDGLLFDLIVFTIEDPKLSSSETNVFRSIAVIPDAVTCDGNVLLITGAVLSGKTATEGNQ
jgi:hypothetical protein